MSTSPLDGQVGAVVLAAERACRELHALAELLSDHAQQLPDGERDPHPRHLEFLSQRLHSHAELLLLEAWGGTSESTQLTARLIRGLLHTPLPASDVSALLASRQTGSQPSTLRQRSLSAMHRLDELRRAGQRAQHEHRLGAVTSSADTPCQR